LWEKNKIVYATSHFKFYSIKGQKKPNLYSIIVNDSNVQKNIPLFDFVTNDFTTLNVTKQLLTLRDNSENFLPAKCPKKPNIVVTDFSYPLINAFFAVYSRMNFAEWLDAMFLVLVDGNTEEKNKIDLRVYLCAFHFLRIIERKVKKRQCGNIKQIELFFQFVRLLQNSKSIKEFNDHLANMFYVFNYKTTNGIIEKSIQSVTTNKSAFMTEKLPKDSEFKASKSEEDKPFNYKKTKQEMKSKSKFNQYFSNFFKNLREKEPMEHDGNKNDFFCPELFQVIVDYLYLMPFWTGCVLWDLKVTRLTNNYIETWFGHLKADLLKGDIVMPSAFISVLFNHIRSLFAQYYNREFEKTTRESLFQTVKDNPALKNIDNWKGENKKRSNAEKARQLEIEQGFVQLADFTNQRQVGLINQGATCYFNAIMQALVRIYK
jgi:hypothetical protein